MKCPCCGEDTARDFVIIHNMIYKNDGTKIKCTPTPLKFFEIMLQDKPIIRTNRIGEGYSLDTHMARLRNFIKEAGLPYSVVFTNDRYTLRINRS